MSTPRHDHEAPANSVLIADACLSCQLRRSACRNHGVDRDGGRHTPPESFFEMVAEKDRDAARQFYKKYAEVDGMPVVAAGEVADEALVRTCEIVSHMLAGRPDVVEQMVKDKMYLIIIGKDQLYAEMPEYRNVPNPAYMERARARHGRPAHELRRRKPVESAARSLRRREHRASTSSATRSTVHCDRSIRIGRSG